MNILTISLNAWNDTQATGNTFSNFFESRDSDMVFSNIYCRNEPIDNQICKNYYRVTESDIVHSLKNRTKHCGKVVLYNPMSNKNRTKLNKPNYLNDFLHKYRPSLLLFIREIIWNTNRWKTTELDQFLKAVSPDVIYMHGHNNRYMHNLLWYCQEKTNAKVIVFWGDDMYGIKSFRPGQLLYHQWLRRKLKYTIQHADLLLGGSDNLCSEYGARFNRVFLPQYKICNTIASPKKQNVNKDIIIVYAGNLLYGRKELLASVSKVLSKINESHKIKIRLHIYSVNQINESDRLVLDDKCNSFFEGSRPYNEICDILNQCSASLFLESFDKNNIRQTRLSFSTKIIDYMQSSSPLIVYGPREIASVQYLEKSNSALVAHNEDELSSIMNAIQQNPIILDDYAEKKYEFAKLNHSTSTLIPRIKSLMNKKVK